MSVRSARPLKQDSIRIPRFYIWILWAACLICFALLSSCATLFPNTAAAIAPEGATVGEAGLALLADFEMWIETVGGWIAYLFGG